MKNTTIYRPFIDMLALVMPIAAAVLATLGILEIFPFGMQPTCSQIIVGCLLLLTPSVSGVSDFQGINLFTAYPKLRDVYNLWLYIFGLTLICGGPQFMCLFPSITTPMAFVVTITLSGILSIIITKRFNN